MNKSCLMMAALMLGLFFAAGCRTANTSNQAWDKTAPDDNRPGYQSGDSPALTRDSRQ